MKKLLLFTTLFFYFFTAYAADLTIGTTGNSNLRVMINNRRMVLRERIVTFENLPAGNYNITIQQLQRRGNLFNYVDVYNGTIRLMSNRHTEIMVMRFGKVTIDEGNIELDNWMGGNNNNGWGNNNGNDNGGWGNNWQNNTVVTEAQFNNVKQSLNGYFTDSDKINAAKGIMKNKWFSVAQIRELANMFFTDANKLTFIRDAYTVCAEPENYFTLSSIFASNSIRNQFIDWLGKQ